MNFGDPSEGNKSCLGLFLADDNIFATSPPSSGGLDLGHFPYQSKHGKGGPRMPSPKARIIRFQFQAKKLTLSHRFLVKVVRVDQKHSIQRHTAVISAPYP